MKSIVSALWGSVAGGNGGGHVDPGVPRVPAAAASSDSRSFAEGGGAAAAVVGSAAYAPSTPVLQTGRSKLVRLATLTGHDDRVWNVAWHPSADVIASCGGDKTIRLWSRDVAAATAAAASSNAAPGNPKDKHWRCIATLDGEHARTVRALAWSPDGTRLAAASFDSTVSIWKRTSAQFDMELESLLEGHDTEVKSVAWSTSGSAIATCARDKLVQLWEDDSPSPTTTTAAALSGGARNDDDDDVADAEDEEDDGEKFYECVGVLAGHSQDVKSVRFHPDCQRVVASCGYDDTVKLWEESTQRKDDWHCTQTITAHANTVWSIEFQPAASSSSSAAAAAAFPRLLASADADGRVMLHRLAIDPDRPEGTQMLTWVRAGGAVAAVHEGPVFGMDWCPVTTPNATGTHHVSSVLATAAADDSVVIFQLAHSPAGGDDDGGDDDNNAAGSFGDLKLEPVVVERAAHEADVNCVRFAPLRRQRPEEESQYRLLATSSDDGTIAIWALFA
jgi:WD40 repeat protein